MTLLDGSRVTVIDADTYASLPTSSWSVVHTYVYGHAVKKYLHAVIAPSSSDQDADGLSVDHINQIKLDNRQCNLRYASQSLQNTNRGVRGDRYDVQAELAAAGVLEMPRFIRWDDACKRYTFADAPFAPPNANSTRASVCTHIGRYLDCLNKYIAVIRGMSEEEVAYSQAELETRVRLADEYKAIVDAAHRFDVSKFPTCDATILPVYHSVATYLAMAVQQRDYLVEKGVTVVTGTPNLVSRHHVVLLADGTQMGILRKGGNVLIYDKAMENYFATMRIDFGTSSTRVWQSNGSRVAIATHVWTACANRTIPDGMTVVPINFERCDMRVANLQLVEGASGKSYKRGGVLEVPSDVDIGMRFIPCGMTLSYENRARRHVVNVNIKGFPKKEIPEAGDKTLQQAFDEGMAALRQDPEFEARNAAYQSRMREFREIMAVVDVDA